MANGRWVLLAIGLLAAGILVGSLSASLGPDQPFEAAVAAPTWEDTVVGIVQSVGPAVVKLVTTREVFLDQFFFQVRQEEEGVGSGVIFHPDGYIVTNNHVVADAREIRAFLPDGRELAGKLVGRDPYTDLAVVKVDGEELPVAELGSSSKLKVGQNVVAIGNPFRFDNSVTTGVVSALGRDISVHPERDFDLTGMIQTDAAINPGNSGGPLLDGEGKVVGINTAVFRPAQGIGFAIPIDLAKGIIDQLLEHGKVIRLGVVGGTLTPQIAAALEEQQGIALGTTRGAYVLRVMPETPAAKGGIKPGDVIVEVNGTKIDSIEEMADLVQRAGFGASLRLVLIRDAAPVELEVVLE